MNDPQLVDAIRKAAQSLNQLATVLATGGDVEHKPDVRPAPKVKRLSAAERKEAVKLWKAQRKKVKANQKEI